MNFLKGIFLDKDGTPSSKRVVLFILLLVFVGIIITNVLTGKQAAQVLQEQLFYLLIYALAAVFGENITGIFSKKQQTLSTGAESTSTDETTDDIVGGRPDDRKPK